jgi:hypothetical protein
MATPAMSSAGMPARAKGNRGKDQIQWSDDVWKALDEAVTGEMMRTRVAAKILPQVHVPKKRTSVESDIVNVPTLANVPRGGQFDPALSVEESQTTRIQEYWTTFLLSVAQMEAEGDEQTPAAIPAATAPQGAANDGRSPMVTVSHRASTAASLALRSANILAQAEDLILLNGANAVANSPLFTGQQIQALDTSLQVDLDNGLLNISPATPAALVTSTPAPATPTVAAIQLPVTQVVPVHPSALGTPGSPPRYAENTLNGVAQGFSLLQGLGHYENYALILHTIPYADLHQALRFTLIEPVEPISHLVKGGIYGTGTVPPFIPITPNSANPGVTPGPVTIPPGGPTGLPGYVLTTPAIGASPAAYTALTDASLPQFQSVVFPEGVTPSAQPAAVLYTGILVSLSGNTMDQVRGLMDDGLDVAVTFNQKDQNEKYRFRVVQRHCLRLKDPTAVILLLFMDS